MQIEKDIEALARGELPFHLFVVNSRPYWQYHAIKILKRWRHPSDVTIEDLIQEMNLQAWQCLSDYDASRGVSLTRYVTWRAVAKAIKVVHKARGAGKRHGKAVSRHAIVFSALAPANADADWYEMMAGAHDPTQDLDGYMDGVARIDNAIVHRPAREAHALAALKLSRFDIEMAGSLLYSDPKLRYVYKLQNPRQATAVVRRAVASV